MPRETFQLAGNAAAIYEAQKVPAIFGPLAEATLNTITLDTDDVILDVACGTGIVARTARRRLGRGPRIVGVDLNEGMIATARCLADEHARSCEWHVADVTRLPFADATFSVAICQQGIQFFPDEVTALGEIRRVLRPNGKILLSVWAGASDLFKALAAALSRHIGEEIGTRSLAPFTYDGAGRLGTVLADLGFKDVTARDITVNRVVDDPESALPREIMANPVGAAVVEHGEAVMHRIVAETIGALTAYRQASGFVVPQRAHLIEAKVP